MADVPFDENFVPKFALENGGNLATIATNTATTVTNTTGVATAANQATGNTSLATIAGSITGTTAQNNIAQIAGATPPLASGDASLAANTAVFSTGMYAGGTTLERLRSVNGASDASSSGIAATGSYNYNGSSWDKQRGNRDNISLVASAAYTTTQTSADQTNYNGRGVVVVLDMTNVGASPSVTLEIDGKDPVSGKYYAILTGVAVTTVSTNVYTVYPGNTVTTNVSASTILPRTWRVKVTANNANSGTYSVGASVIL